MTRLLALLLCCACAESPGTLPGERSSQEAGGSEPMSPAAQTVIERPRSAAPETSAPSGMRCETALPLAGSGESDVLISTTAAAPPPLGCAAALGASSAYLVLDLSDAPAPTPVQLVFDAPVAFEVGLARGACGDLHVEQCATSLYSEERSRILSATLTPDRYTLLVDGAAAAALHISASTGALSCSAAPENDECATALPIDAKIPVQSLRGTLACAHPSLTLRCGAIGGPDLFYTLDLRDRAGETLLDVDVSSLGDRAVTAALLAPASDGCGEIWMCGAQFSARLAPGLYRVGVSDAERYMIGTADPAVHTAADGQPSPFALRIGLDEADCSQTLNTSWQTAIDLDPTAAQQRVRGNTACGTALLGAPCLGDRGAPELYYRLDLRGAPSTRDLEVHNLLGNDTVSYVLLADAEGGPPRYAGCDRDQDSYGSYDLAPRLYYLVIDGRVRNAARFDLELTLTSELEQPLACLTIETEFCMADSEPACSDSMAQPRCLASAVECGLERSVYDAFCNGAPGCCSGTEDPIDCLQAWQSTVQCR